MWVRGLKLYIIVVSKWVFPSHPMWVRGLKQKLEVRNDRAEEVAPYVGAWIETLPEHLPTADMSVAPYVGAWIET